MTITVLLWIAGISFGVVWFIKDREKAQRHEKLLNEIRGLQSTLDEIADNTKPRDEYE